MSGLKRLFERGHIGRMDIKNRIVMPAMGTNLATSDGYVSEQLKEYYEERAEGGVGLIIIETTCVDSPEGKGLANQLLVDNDKFIPGLSELAETVHRHGAKVALQLQHSGRASKSCVTCRLPVGPSPIIQPPSASEAGGELPRQLSIAEIETIISRFAEAAQRAQKAGFDGVEIHAAHRYLLAQFLSPVSNQRTDIYGGSLENRARLLIEIIGAVRKSTNGNFPVWCRINGREFGVDGGSTTEEGQKLARMCQTAGADAIHVSAVAWGLNPRTTPPTAVRAGNLLPLAGAIKQSVDIPVIAVGRIVPDLGERALEEGKADFVAIGRGLIVDPRLSSKAAAGKLSDIVPCAGCMTCLHTVLEGGSIRCMVNAAAGREREFRITPAEKAKRVVVVGSGPAGMEAARVAALRGHKVTLYEMADRLGGNLLYATIPPNKDNLKGLIPYLSRQVETLCDKVELGKKADPSTIEGAKPDAVVIATGASFSVPPIRGLSKDKAVAAVDALAGRTETGDKVLVIGGDLIGCETAEFLADKGKKVTIIEIASNMAASAGVLGKLLLKRLESKGVTLLANVRHEEVQDKRVTIVTSDGCTNIIDIDTIVIATGATPNRELVFALQGKGIDVWLAGDCIEPRKIIDAIADGSRIGRML